MSPGKCLNCGNSFDPRHPTQRFCPKNESGRRLCKDQFHNRERAKLGRLSVQRRDYIADRAAKNRPDILAMIDQKLSRRLRMVDDHERIFDGVPTKNGVEVGPDFVGITDQEHEQIMNEMGDDF